MTSPEVNEGGGEAGDLASADVGPVPRWVAELDARACFGPSFFVTQLGAFVRDRCPTPAEALPVVEFHLVSGDVLEVCHVIGLAPGWVALAVFERRDSDGPPSMRTELLPYAAILRVTIRAAATGGRRVGFFAADRVAVLLEGGTDPVRSGTPEGLLAKVAGRGPG